MSLTEKQYVVYKHTNKTNGKVYIGITRQKPERRWQNGRGYDGTYFGNAIAKYGWAGFDHEIIYTGLSKSLACEAEKKLIREYKSNDRRLGYNVCEGGQTGDNLLPHLGGDNCRAVSVRRTDPATGQSVVFQTVADAATTMGINYRGISKACRGISKTYKGYVWEYVGVAFEKQARPPRGKYDHVKQRKRVSVVDTDGKRYTFGSIMEAAEKYGLRANTAARYVSGVRKDGTGRRWSACL